MMNNERLITLLYNTIVCLKEFGSDIEFEIGITDEEYKEVINKVENSF